MDLKRFVLAGDQMARFESNLSLQFHQGNFDSALVPDVLLIGAPRCGTTFLSALLREHPEVFVPPIKELKFFSSNFLRLDLNWYLSEFRPGRTKIKVDATPSYSILSASRIEQIRAMNPAMKIILSIREPGLRIASSYTHFFHAFTPDPGHVAATAFSDGFAAYSDYGNILERWLSVFPPENILILTFDELVADKEAFVRKALNFLGADPAWSLPEMPIESRNASHIDQTVWGQIEGRYAALFAPRVSKLRALLEEKFAGFDFPSWLTEGHYDNWPTRAKLMDCATPPGYSVFLVEGHYVCGPSEVLQRDIGLDELLRRSLDHPGICIGRFLTEVTALSLFRSDYQKNRLASLANDIAASDVFLAREQFWGWNIIFFDNRFLCADPRAGDIEFRSLAAEQFNDLVKKGLLRQFGTLNEAIDFCVDSWTSGTTLPFRSLATQS